MEDLCGEILGEDHRRHSSEACAEGLGLATGSGFGLCALLIGFQDPSGWFRPEVNPEPKWGLFVLPAFAKLSTRGQVLRGRGAPSLAEETDSTMRCMSTQKSVPLHSVGLTPGKCISACSLSYETDSHVCLGQKGSEHNLPFISGIPPGPGVVAGREAPTIML